MIKPEVDCVFIETTTACTRSCDWCTRSHHEIKPDFMSEELFIKIISELGTIGFNGRLSLFQNGEPLLDKRLRKWHEISKQYCPDAFTCIFSNGDLLTREIASDLLTSGLDAMKVNTYDKKTFKRVSEIINTIEEPFSKMILLQDFSEKKEWTNRGGTVPFGNSQAKSLSDICLRPFKQIYITCEGTVAQCCSDYLKKNIMGDVNRQSLMEIWEGKPFSELRESLLGKLPLNELCKVCNLETDYLTVDDFKHVFSAISNV